MATNKMPKFNRATNFSSSEEQLLIMLINKYKNIIECKITDACSPAEKSIAWEKLTKEFNCNSGSQFRTTETLKRKYDNMKKRARQKFANEKMKITATGGGPYKEIKITETDEEIKKILGTSLTGCSSKFDDDICIGTNENEENMLKKCINISKLNGEQEVNKLDRNTRRICVLQDIPILLNSPNIEIIEDTKLSEDNNTQNKNFVADGVQHTQSLQNMSYEVTVEDSSQSNCQDYSVTDWSQYTPKMLKQKKAKLLQNEVKNVPCKVPKTDKTGRALENKLIAWTDGKTEMTVFQKQCYIEEYKLKLKHLQERHDKSMELEERESRERIQAIREEHELKMEILKIEKKRKLT